MTPTPTTLLEAVPSPAAEMVLAGRSQLGELQSHLDRLDAQIATGEATLETLAHARAERDQVLHEAQGGLQILENGHSQAQSYAKLAHRQPNEQQAIKATSTAKSAASAARKDLDHLSKEQDVINRAQEVQEQELRESIYRAEIERETRLAELEAVQRGMGQAMRELGIERHAALMQGYREHMAHADELHTQLIDAQVAAYEYHTAALEALKEWPELQKDMQHQVPVDDGTIRCLAATLLYVETILNDVTALDELPPDLKRRGLTLWDNIQIPPEVIAQARRYPQGLQQYRDRITTVLQAYRAYLEEQ